LFYDPSFCFIFYLSLTVHLQFATGLSEISRKGGSSPAEFCSFDIENILHFPLQLADKAMII
jgi:hypothetical protein